MTSKFSWLKLPVSIAILVAVGFAFITVQGPNPALAYDDYLGIDCNDNPVTEGYTFRIHIISTQPYLYAKETIKVHWTTIPMTADESDYRPLYNEGQASNGYQTEHSRMGRTFYTVQNPFSEFPEKFKVRAVNASSDGSGAGSCIVQINDDDGPGAAKTWIDSTPSGHSAQSPDEVPDDTASPWYNSGETIRVKQQFTEKVVVSGGEVNLGLRIGTADDYVRKSAVYVDGSGTDTLTFEYQVTDEDSDSDGIEVPRSDYGGEGALLTLNGNKEVNSAYLGVDGGEGQQVYKGPYVKEMSVTSTPNNGDTYRFGEAIEIKAKFDRAVQVDSSPSISIQIGATTDSWVAATYQGGSGTDTLTFRYVVPAGAFDYEGISVETGYVDDDDATHGIAASAVITDTVESLALDPYYDGIDDHPAHKVDGRPYITGISVATTPYDDAHYRYRDRVNFSLEFDQDVAVSGLPSIPVWIGSVEDGRQELAKYSTGSQTDTLTFSYKVQEDDLDTDGVSIPERIGFLGPGEVRMPDGGRLVDDFIPGLQPQSSHMIDGRLPYIVSASFTSTPADGEIYRLGEDIEVSLSFDKKVSALGRPTIRLLLGDSASRRNATYGGGAGTDTLVFSYEVQATDLDEDGIALMQRESDGIDGPYRVYEKGTENKVKATIAGIDDQPEHKVDGRPYVVSAAITSTPASRGIYRAGESVEVSLVFDRRVDVEGSPTIVISVGQGEVANRDATYLSGSGSTTLVFAYEVVSTDEDSDGVSLPAKDGDGFGGEATITASGTEVEANGELPGLDDQLLHMVDGEVAVVSVAIDSDPGYDSTYEKGDTVEVVVEFDDTVTVTGAPRINLDLDGSAAVAEFQEVRNESGDAEETGTTLVFTYTIQEGDEDVDGIAINENSLVLNRGTIADDGGNAANLAHDSVLAEGHLVGAVPPVLESAAVSEDGTEVVLTFSERVHVLPEIRVLSAFAGVDVGIYLQTLVDIFVEDHRPYITDASVSDTRLTLTLDTPVTTGQLVEVAYDNIFASDVSGLLVDEADNPLEPFSRQEATNNSTEPDNPQALWPEVATHSLTVPNGGSNTYTMWLSAQPAEDVTVSLTVLPEGHVTASPMELTFTSEDWDTPQTITLTAGAHDHDLNFWQEIIHTSDAEDFISGHMKVLVEN